MASRFIDWLTGLTAKSTTIDGTEITHIGSSGLSQKATLANAVSYTAPVLAQDWSSSGRGAGGATVTGIKFNATGTDATSASSALMELQVAGTNKFSVDKAGVVTSASRMVATAVVSSSINVGTNLKNSPVWNTSGIRLDVADTLNWTSTTNSATVDIGMKRDSAGILKITDGSTGTGKLIFIVPTTNPGIAGALWNNAGTLSISAG